MNIYIALGLVPLFLSALAGLISFFFSAIISPSSPSQEEFLSQQAAESDGHSTPYLPTSLKEELWEQLIKIQTMEMQAVEAEKAKIEKEKKSMTKIKADPSDIITINAGGQVIIKAHRDTLCLASGSIFSSMFTGRWNESLAKDEDGHFFLDHDPEMIQWIINHLRLKKIEDPSNPVQPPQIPEEKKDSFMVLLRYFALDEFMYPVLPFPHNLHPVPSSSADIVVSSLGKHKYQVARKGSATGGQFIAFSPAMKSDQTFYWKCTVVSFARRNGDLYLGVIGTDSPSDNSRSKSHPTSFGWAKHPIVRGNGPPPTSAESSFVQGEVLYFQLRNQTLKMYSNVRNQSTFIPDVPKNSFIHFNLAQRGTVVELERLLESEIGEIDWLK